MKILFITDSNINNTGGLERAGILLKISLLRNHIIVQTLIKIISIKK